MSNPPPLRRDGHSSPSGLRPFGRVHDGDTYQEASRTGTGVRTNLSGSPRISGETLVQNED
jgi:hypothetical protein